MRAAGTKPVAVRNVAELELFLGDPDRGESLHIVGASGGTPGAVVERAIRFPDKLVVIAGSVRGVSSQFTSVLTRSEAELLVVLDESDNVAEQIRRCLPLWLTRRWVDAVLRPGVESRLSIWSSEDRKRLGRFLQECPVVHGSMGRVRCRRRS
jgi:hypothetical protein